MNFHVITLFPDVLDAAVRGFGVVGQAVNKGLIGVTCVTPRSFTTNVHHTIDDRPFGGGDGMIMMAEPLSQSLAQIRNSIASRAPSKTDRKSMRVIHVSPRGTPFSDAKARELATFEDLVLISSRYGGADQRFLNLEVDEEVSIGDYILTGGELAVLVMIDAVARLQPGVLGNESSSKNESFSGANGLLEHPQYTRPREWNGLGVPETYLGGDHAKINAFQEALSVGLTAIRRPDLLLKATFTAKQLAAIQKTLAELSDEQLELCGLARPGQASATRQILQNELGRIQPASK